MKNIVLKNVLPALFLMGLVTGCKKENPPQDGVPNVAVSFSANINNVGYTNLQNALGFVDVSGGYNNNGVLLYCTMPNNFLAFDMSCPYDCQSNSKAVIGVQAGNITAHCPVCGTTYTLNGGYVTGGPGIIALKQYTLTYNNPTITVTSP
jgi:Rieske Fe-S protein